MEEPGSGYLPTCCVELPAALQEGHVDSFDPRLDALLVLAAHLVALHEVLEG